MKTISEHESRACLSWNGICPSGCTKFGVYSTSIQKTSSWWMLSKLALPVILLQIALNLVPMDLQNPQGYSSLAIPDESRKIIAVEFKLHKFS